MKKTFLLSAMTLAVVAALSSSPSYAMTNTDNKFWWPEQLDLRPLRQNGIESNPLCNHPLKSVHSYLEFSVVNYDIGEPNEEITLHRNPDYKNPQGG